VPHGCIKVSNVIEADANGLILVVCGCGYKRDRTQEGGLVTRKLAQVGLCWPALF
jgi:hypothetical protein